MFRHYRVILRELVNNISPNYASISNAAVGNTIYQQLHLKYLCNLTRYWLQVPWGWHDSVETCRSVIICEIIVRLLVIVQNHNKNKIKQLVVCIYHFIETGIKSTYLALRTEWFLYVPRVLTLIKLHFWHLFEMRVSHVTSRGD